MEIKNAVNSVEINTDDNEIEMTIATFIPQSATYDAMRAAGFKKSMLKTFKAPMSAAAIQFAQTFRENGFALHIWRDNTAETIETLVKETGWSGKVYFIDDGKNYIFDNPRQMLEYIKK